MNVGKSQNPYVSVSLMGEQLPPIHGCSEVEVTSVHVIFRHFDAKFHRKTSKSMGI